MQLNKIILIFLIPCFIYFCKPNIDRSTEPLVFYQISANLISIYYSQSSFNLTQNASISKISPTTKGNITNCSVNPSLPQGLTLDTTCNITGTPSISQSTLSYAITANNASSSASANIQISVASSTSNSTNAIPTLSYTGSPFFFTQGVGITTINPTVTGSIISYSIAPALPTGLTLNATTGQVSGTPTILSATTTYTVTGNHSTGTITAALDITVNDVAPSGLSYTGSPFSFPDFVLIGTLTPTITGTPTSCNSAPALPTGLAISATCVITGTPTTVQASATYTITASNSGGNTSTTIDIAITTFANKRIFVTAAGYLPGVQFTSPVTADTLCNADGAKPPGGGLFKAMIVGLGRVACLLPNCPGGGAEHTNWIFIPTTTYYQPDGVTVIATTDGSGLMPAGFVNPATPNAKYWTGLNNDWTTSAFNCANWTSVGNSSCGGQNPNTGVNNFTDIWGGVTCGAAQQLLCVQQ
jgi:hypothetical protein